MTIFISLNNNYHILSKRLSPHPCSSLTACFPQASSSASVLLSQLSLSLFPCPSFHLDCPAHRSPLASLFHSIISSSLTGSGPSSSPFLYSKQHATFPWPFSYLINLCIACSFVSCLSPAETLSNLLPHCQPMKLCGIVTKGARCCFRPFTKTKLFSWLPQACYHPH